MGVQTDFVVAPREDAKAVFEDGTVAFEQTLPDDEASESVVYAFPDALTAALANLDDASTKRLAERWASASAAPLERAEFEWFLTEIAKGFNEAHFMALKHVVLGTSGPFGQKADQPTSRNPWTGGELAIGAGSEFEVLANDNDGGATMVLVVASSSIYGGGDAPSLPRKHPYEFRIRCIMSTLSKRKGRVS